MDVLAKALSAAEAARGPQTVHEKNQVEMKAQLAVQAAERNALCKSILDWSMTFAGSDIFSKLVKSQPGATSVTVYAPVGNYGAFQIKTVAKDGSMIYVYQGAFRSPTIPDTMSMATPAEMSASPLPTRFLRLLLAHITGSDVYTFLAKSVRT